MLLWDYIRNVIVYEYDFMGGGCNLFPWKLSCWFLILYHSCCFVWYVQKFDKKNIKGVMVCAMSWVSAESLTQNKILFLKSCKISAIETILEHNTGYESHQYQHLSQGPELPSDGITFRKKREVRKGVKGLQFFFQFLCVAWFKCFLQLAY